MKNIFLEIPNKTDDYLCLIDGDSHTIWAYLMNLSEGDHIAMCAVLSKKEYKNLPDLNT
ncbi:MAG: Ykof family thiamine-binding protein [Lentisphaeraceae bacterium]|nr:Ykof family thiamine-binding protein [Lentisphaeraceae bacterium]